MRICENTVLRGIIGSKREEVTGKSKGKVHPRTGHQVPNGE
jgi:hypothetical protein